MKEPLVSRMLTISLYIIFVLGVLSVITLPLMLDFYFKYFYDAYAIKPEYRTFILTFLVTAAIGVLWIVSEAIRMLRTIPQDPFVMRNVRALKRVGVVLLALSALFFAKCFLYVTFLTMGCGFLFLVCGLFAFTLTSLFRQAVAFKEENDLTI